MAVHEQVNLLEIGELEAINTVVHRRMGKKISPATIWRWTHKGVRGNIRLESVFAGGRWCTTSAAFADFLNRQTKHRLSADDEPQGRSPATERRLQAAGLLDAT